MQNNSIRNAVIYTRVSTDEQAEVGFSLGHQKESLEKYCEFHNIKVLKCYREDASGKDFNRPAFKEMFEFIKNKKNQVDAVIFTRWDRFSRNTMETLRIINEMKSMEVKLVSTEQAVDDSSPEHKLMLTIYNSIAEIERDKISIRTKEGMRRAMKEGYFTNNPPIGYKRKKINGGKPSLEPDKSAPLIRQIFEDYAKGIYTIEDIRLKYWEKGLKRSYSGMQSLLQNITYNAKIKIAKWKDEEEVIVHAQHEPIIEDELFQKVQRVLHGVQWKMDSKVKRNEDFPLRGHLKCSKCGRNITGSVNRSQNKSQYFYYHCQDVCKERFRADEAHEKLSDYIKSMTIKPEVKKAYMKFMERVFIQKEGSREQEIKIIQSKIQRNIELKNGLEDKYVEDLIDKETFKGAKKRYEEEIARLEQDLKDAKELETGYMRYLNEALSLIENLSYHYEIANWEEKQKLLTILFPEKLIFKNGQFTSPSGEGIRLLVENIRQYEKQGASNDPSVNELKALKKIRRVG